MNAPGQGHNSATIDAGDWAFEVAQTRAHAFIKLIVHTLRLLVKDGEADADISDEDLSRLTSLSTKTVQRYRQMAKDEGWLEFTVGKGRSKVSSYRISVPMETINQIAARLDALTKNRTHSPPSVEKVDCESTFSAETRTSSPPLTSKPDQQSTFDDENRTDSPTGSPPSVEVKKENPPDPLKKKTTPKNNNHHSKETASEFGGGQELAGLNGATTVVVEKLAGWINPSIPDRVTARATLENLVKIYPPEIVRDSFAHLEAKMLSGDFVPSPIKYFAGTCRGMRASAEKDRRDEKKPPGMPDHVWRRIQEAKARQPA